MKTIEQRMRHATQLLGKVKICLLAGGYSSESQGSRENAKTLLPYLKKSCMDAGIVDFDSKDDLIQRLRPWDYILNICYGVGGEDGQLQGFLSTMQITARTMRCAKLKPNDAAPDRATRRTSALSGSLPRGRR